MPIVSATLSSADAAATEHSEHSERGEPAYELGLTLPAGERRSTPSLPRASVTTLPPPPSRPAALPLASAHPVELGARIGAGGMGVVHAGRQRALRREVAIKRAHCDSGEHARRALLREALITGALQHPNIVPIYTLEHDAQGTPLVVMQRVRGESWSARLARRQGPGEQLQAQLDVLLQVCNAVRFAHSRGIIHRDIKPDNVMIGDFGEVYLLDWGLALAVDDDEQSVAPLGTQLGLEHADEATALVGTPAYMAPEMVDRNVAKISRRTDVYLLGAVLHEIITGQPPHQGDTIIAQLRAAWTATPPEYPAEVDSELARICQRALHRDPRERYHSVDGLADAMLRAKRHSVSRQLCEEAEQRRRALECLLARSGDDDDSRLSTRAVRNVFVECRFAYRQALKSWPDNPRARAGLHDVLQRMVSCEIDEGAYHAAVALVDEMSEPPDAALLQRIESLRQRRERDRERLQQLAAMQASMDISVQRGPRLIAGVASSVGWLLYGLVAALVSSLGIYQAGVGAHMIFNGIYALCTLSLLIVMHGQLTAVTRKLVGVALIGCAATFGLQAVCLARGTPISTMLAIHLLVMSTLLFPVAMAIDRRLALMAVTLDVGAVLILCWPAHALAIWGLAGGIGGALSVVGAMPTPASQWRPAQTSPPTTLARAE